MKTTGGPGHDAVVRPKHYTSASIEPIEVINAWDLNFNLGNVIKYVARAGKKRRSTLVQDLQKARQYLDFEIMRYADNTHLSRTQHSGNATGKQEQTSNASNTSGGEVSEV